LLNKIVLLFFVYSAFFSQRHWQDVKKSIFQIHLFKYNTNPLTYLLTYHLRLTDINITIKLYLMHNAHLMGIWKVEL